MSRNRTVRLLTLAMLWVLPACSDMVTYTSYPSIGPLSGMTFTSPGYDYEVKVTDESGATPWGTGRYLRATYVLTVLRVDFTPAVTAFATLMMIDNGGSGGEMIVTVRNSLATWYSARVPTSAKPTGHFLTTE